MRAQRIRVGPKSRESILTGDRKDTQGPQEDGQAKTEAETGIMLLQPKEAWLEPAGAGKGRKGFSPATFRRSAALMTPWLWTYDLQTEVWMCKNTFLFLKVTKFVTAVLGKSYALQCINIALVQILLISHWNLSFNLLSIKFSSPLTFLCCFQSHWFYLSFLSFILTRLTTFMSPSSFVRGHLKLL